jgi:hypothetical protein
MAGENQIAESVLQPTSAYTTRRYDSAQSARLVVHANTALVATGAKSVHPTSCAYTTVGIKIAEFVPRKISVPTILKDKAARFVLPAASVNTIFSL